MIIRRVINEKPTGNGSTVELKFTRVFIYSLLAHVAKLEGKFLVSLGGGGLTRWLSVSLLIEREPIMLPNRLPTGHFTSTLCVTMSCD